MQELHGYRRLTRLAFNVLLFVGGMMAGALLHSLLST